MGLVATGNIDHRWQRAHILQAYAQGKVGKEEICDADFLLKTAADFHGHDSVRLDGRCPICEKDSLREVWWIHGPALGRASGTARSWPEIIDIARALGPDKEFDLHTVEVCPRCGWNHLLLQQSIRWVEEE